MIMLIFFQKPYSNFNVNHFLKVIKSVFIPKSFNTNISNFVNLHHEKTNLKGYFVLKTGLKIYDIQK